MSNSITIQTLLIYDQQNVQLKDNVLGYYNRGKMKNFYDKFGGILTLTKQKINTLQEEFFVFEGEAIKYEGEGSERKAVMKEGKTMIDYNSRYASIVNVPAGVI